MTFIRSFIRRLISRERLVPVKSTPQPSFEKSMNFRDLTASIAQTEDIPVDEVRNVSRALLERIALAIDSGEKLQLPTLSFITRTIPEREATEDGTKPWRPEIKAARIFRKRKDAEG